MSWFTKLFGRSGSTPSVSARRPPRARLAVEGLDERVVPSAVAVDYGSAGLWRWTAATGFQQITYHDPTEVDIDDAGTVVGSFGHGQYRLTVGGSWQQLNPTSPQQTELTSSGDVISDFGTAGLKRWRASGGGWQHLTDASPTDFEVADNGDVFGNFGNGLWRYRGSSWLQLTPYVPQEFEVADDGTLFADYGASGLYRYGPSGGWTQLHTWNPEDIEVSDNGVVYADFGSNGLYRYGARWDYLTPWSPTEMDTSATGDLLAEFTGGVWRWTATAGWSRFDDYGSYKSYTMTATGEVFADVGTGGTWRRAPGGAWVQLSASIAGLRGLDPQEVTARR